METRQDRERAFHNRIFGQEGVNARGTVTPFYDSGRKALSVYEDTVRRSIKGCSALEYGCGSSGWTFRFSDSAKYITAIDISDTVIDLNAKKARVNGHSDVEFKAMDAENMTFAEDSFDFVYGAGILHHLDLRTCYAEISRVLRPGGKAIFLEPLNHNMIINMYRKMTPNMRTEDEHPLTMSDIEMAGEYFNSVESEFFSLLTLGAIPFWKTPVFTNLLGTLEVVESLLFEKFPFSQRYAWMTILTFQN